MSLNDTNNTNNQTFINTTNDTLNFTSLLLEAQKLQQAVDTGHTHNFLFLIFLMQIAFSLYEIAATRHKNHIFALIKNTIAIGVAILTWWLVGFAFYWGLSSNGGIGTTFFAEDYYMNNDEVYNKFVVSCGLLIVSLLVALSIIVERIDLHTTVIFSFFYSVAIFPIGAHWGTNQQGWLAKMGFVDLTGVGFVHLSGATAGLAALLITGPRLNRYSEEKKKDFKLSNLQYLGLSTLVFWFTRYGLNNACLMHAVSNSTTNYSLLIGKTSMNTTIAPAASSLLAFIIIYIFNRNTDEEYSLLALSNGLITGLIAVSGSPGTIPSWGSLLIGILSAFIYSFYAWAIRKLKLDDPIEAFAVNFTGGTWGLVAVGWFDYKNGIIYGQQGHQFGIQLLGMVIYMFWPFACTGVLFLLLKLCRIHRLKDDVENQGVDIFKCGGLSYNLDEVSIEEYFSQLTDSTQAKLQYIKATENILQTERNNMEKDKKPADDEDAINVDVLERRKISPSKSQQRDEDIDHNKI